MDNCIICKIVSSPEKNFVVYEDEGYIAFLDIRPVFLGHCLLSPKTHYSTFYDLPNEKIEDYFTLLKRLGKSVEKAVSAQGTFIAMNNKISQSIPHLHCHIIPRNKGDGLKGFFWPRVSYQDDAQKKEIQLRIKKNIGEIVGEDR